MSAKQVQLLQVEDNNFQLNVDELETILLADNVKDLPVVVVSVAGAYRQGKSFLLNFFLQYLRNNGRPNWLRDMTIPFEGFEWKPGCHRHTTGILLWKEVFLMTKSNGEKVAVLLMDTQGTFDCESTVKENTTIFSLSMLTSSVQVYNLMNNIKEDDLQHLQFFAEYSRLAQKESGKTFQKLLFLVRDWRAEQDYEYGAKGGRELLKKRLAIKEGQAEELKELRQRIKSCFSEIGCFLMPPPGDKVASGKSFEGRLDDISEDFRAKLEELIPSILASKNLLVKEIDGRKISCQELLTLFRAYADVFQGNELPKAESVLQATVVATNVTAVDKARRFYMDQMKYRPQRNLRRLVNFHKCLMAATKKRFKDHPRMGGDKVSTTYFEDLTEELEEHFCRLFKDEEQAIKKEEEEEAERQRERDEEHRREEKRESERCEERKKEEQRKKEREEDRKREEKRERERCEERKKEEQRKRERDDDRKREEERKREREAERKREEQSEREIKQERERAAKAEAEQKKEMEAMKAKAEEMQKQLLERKTSRAEQIIKGIFSIPGIIVSSVLFPPAVRPLVEDMIDNFAG
ncbi:atlastin-2-like [Dermacentor albipictus]|uniref:atlastin-2-like n=1 Tax=Dermacentor albipictus TaxID=60249 RepID=UPI0031FDAC9B